jgi:pimeloyl-ACP methyl ester carboxylesterase
MHWTIDISRRVSGGLVMASAAIFGIGSPAFSEVSGNAFEFVECAALDFSPSDLGADVACGWLTVPESRSSPGRNIRLPVIIAQSTSESSKNDPILYLHGGPGIATLDVVPRALRGKSWPLLREKHDLVFFDQRGTGRSTPRLCPEFDKTLSALTARGLNQRDKAAAQRDAAQACRDELRDVGVSPQAYSSTEIAADVEALRLALGKDRWNIFATSYGSLPAAEVIRRWPTTVRSLILDSAFPPTSPNRAEQINATAESFAAFQRRCDNIAACRDMFPSLRKSAELVSSRLDNRPIRTETGQINGETFRDALWTLMVDGSTAAYLPELLRRAEGGDEQLIRNFVRVFGDSSYFGGYAHVQAWLVNCHDIFPRPSRRMQASAAKTHPDLARGIELGQQDAMCNILQPSHANAAFYRAPKSSVPTLILFGEFDPATPRSDATAARKFFRRATLVEVDGASHAPFYTDGCTKGITLAFIANPTARVENACLANRLPFAFATTPEFDSFVATLKD